ncbi:MAG: hypothetical protein IT559_01010 [Alphaproteobacteria bacterium]|nr:hypothetical protein [Alphaproteobacteria bacterium]
MNNAAVFLTAADFDKKVKGPGSLEETAYIALEGLSFCAQEASQSDDGIKVEYLSLVETIGKICEDMNIPAYLKDLTLQRRIDRYFPDWNRDLQP